MYLYGASGHCKVVIEIIRASHNFKIEGIVDDNPKTDNLFGILVINSIKLNSFVDKNFIVTIGDNSNRKKIVDLIKANFLSVFHPKSIVSPSANIKEGCVIMAGAIVNSDVSIGKHCIVNSGAIVEHDSIIGDFVHVSPSATLSGNVTIGEGTHIGVSASVIQGITIGKWVTVGASCVVIRDVPDFAVIVGNPGRIIKYNKQKNNE